MFSTVVDTNIPCCAMPNYAMLHYTMLNYAMYYAVLYYITRQCSLHTLYCGRLKHNIITVLYYTILCRSEPCCSKMKSNQFYLCLTEITITLPQWALQSVHWTISSVLRPSIQVRKNIPCEENPFSRRDEKKMENNLSLNYREGIPHPPRWADMQ